MWRLRQYEVNIILASLRLKLKTPYTMLVWMPHMDTQLPQAWSILQNNWCSCRQRASEDKFLTSQQHTYAQYLTSLSDNTCEKRYNSLDPVSSFQPAHEKVKGVNCASPCEQKNKHTQISNKWRNINQTRKTICTRSLCSVLRHRVLSVIKYNVLKLSAWYFNQRGADYRKRRQTININGNMKALPRKLKLSQAMDKCAGNIDCYTCTKTCKMRSIFMNWIPQSSASVNTIRTWEMHKIDWLQQFVLSYRNNCHYNHLTLGC